MFCVMFKRFYICLLLYILIVCVSKIFFLSSDIVRKLLEIYLFWKIKSSIIMRFIFWGGGVI